MPRHLVPVMLLPPVMDLVGLAGQAYLYDFVLLKWMPLFALLIVALVNRIPGRTGTFTAVLIMCALLGAGQYVLQNPPPSLLPKSLRGWDRVFCDTGLFIRNSLSPGELPFVNSSVRGELIYYAGRNLRTNAEPAHVVKEMSKAGAQDAAIFFYDGLQPPETGWIARLARPVHFIGKHIVCVARVRMKTEEAEFVFQSDGSSSVGPGWIVDGKLAIGTGSSLLTWIKSGTVLRFATGDAVVTGSEFSGGMEYLTFNRKLDPAMEGIPVRATCRVSLNDLVHD